MTPGGGATSATTRPWWAGLWPAGSTKRRRSPIWTKVVLAIGVLGLLGSTGSLVTLQAGLDQVDRAVKQENLLGEPTATSTATAIPFTGTSIDGPINILMVGIGGVTESDPTDSIIVAHIPATHDRVYLISIPRDTSVDIPADPATNFYGGSYKVNAAYVYGSLNGGGIAGGFQLLAKTIEQTWGLTFNGALAINFGGFVDVMKELGGVDMYIDETTTSIHDGYFTAKGPASPNTQPYNIDPNSGVPICSDPNVTFEQDPLRCAKPGITPVQYLKGWRHLDPWQALDFVRCRDGLVGTDYGRQRHQQQFLRAVVTEAFQKGFSDPLKLTSFLTAIGNALIFDGQGVSINDWVFTLKGITPSSMVTIKTNDGQFVEYTGPAPDKRQALNSDSLDLLAAARDDRAGSDLVGQFVLAHPDWVSS
jgi:LCP family protein required for cell wall assembly